MSLLVCVYVCVCLYLSDGTYSCLPCVSMCSSAGSKEACYSDLWLMSAFGQQVCMCVSVCVYVRIRARPVWSQI